MSTWLLFYPAFNITRIFYFLTYRCGYDKCIDSLFGLEKELILCIILLYVTPWIFLLLGIYLYEVLPQQFGVRKHPLFFLDCLKSNKKKALRSNSDVEAIDVEKNLTDNELQNESMKVREVRNDRDSYPLIADNLTKVGVVLYRYMNLKIKRKNRRKL
jgi:hypothetical protein